MDDQNPYKPPQERCYGPPCRRPRVGVWRFTAIGAFLGMLICERFFQPPFGNGRGSFDDALLVLFTLAGGYVGYSVRTMRLSPFSH